MIVPPCMTVLERGWLSSNNIVFRGEQTAVVDSGYVTHSDQTVQLVANALGGQALALLVNTHLHSDHCGGNAALQDHHPGVRTLVPPGQLASVRRWDPVALSYVPTGQNCPRFQADGALQPGGSIRLGDLDWEIHAAPGHDAHAVLLFQPDHRILLSADALWETGFGVVFPELEGEDAFADVGRTLDVIEELAPRLVIPGHGKPFATVAEALHLARHRLDAFQKSPEKHAHHAAKVLLKFKLLEVQEVALEAFLDWATQTAYFLVIHRQWASTLPMRGWCNALLSDLLRSGNARLESGILRNA